MSAAGKQNRLRRIVRSLLLIGEGNLLEELCFFKGKDDICEEIDADQSHDDTPDRMAG